MPEDVLNRTDIDIAVVGEGEDTLCDILSGKPLKNIKGVFYKDEGKIIQNAPRKLITNLDNLPMPAVHLLDVPMYRNPRVVARKNPVGTIEATRGCVFDCAYCNRGVFGKTFRCKSAKRVADEFELFKRAGFKEIAVWDPLFSGNISNAKKVCDEITTRKLNIPWQLFSGLRVDCVDQELFYKLKSAGCYRIAFGYESGNEQILKSINKNTTIKQAFDSTKMAKKANIEVVGFFMIGFPGETIDTIKETINFAIKLDINFAKVSILVPFPKTAIYREWKKKNIIVSEDWSKYNFHIPYKVYKHPNIDWETLNYYYKLFYRKFYIRPRFIGKRLLRSVIRGEILCDIHYAIKTFS